MRLSKTTIKTSETSRRAVFDGVRDSELLPTSILVGMVLASVFASPCHVAAQVAVRGAKVYTMVGPPIDDGMVIVRDGKIAAVGSASDLRVPEGFRVLEAAVVTPGLVDAHSVVGLAGYLNQPQDSDQLERSAPLQPELRALDAYNVHERLVEWIRGFGVTTLHTGHAPGELISGQTMVVKTRGDSVEEAVLIETKMLAATLSTEARKDDGSPGTRGKMVALLRAQLLKAQEYRTARVAAAKAQAEAKDPEDSQGVVPESDGASKGDSDAEALPRDLGLEVLARVLGGELPLLVTAHRAQDIASALRLAREFKFPLVLDGAAEAYLLIDEIKAAGAAVILHPTMARAHRDLENMSFETAATLRAAGIRVALQSGYESYVPKTRVVLFEAALLAANGLSPEEALETVTIDAARILGVDDRVGSLVVGKDGDLALYDGDPLEYTSHCIGVVIEGVVVSDEKR